MHNFWASCFNESKCLVSVVILQTVFACISNNFWYIFIDFHLLFLHERGSGGGPVAPANFSNTGGRIREGKGASIETISPASGGGPKGNQRKSTDIWIYLYIPSFSDSYHLIDYYDYSTVRQSFHFISLYMQFITILKSKGHERKRTETNGKERKPAKINGYLNIFVYPFI